MPVARLLLLGSLALAACSAGSTEPDSPGLSGNFEGVFMPFVGDYAAMSLRESQGTVTGVAFVTGTRATVSGTYRPPDLMLELVAPGTTAQPIHFVGRLDGSSLTGDLRFGDRSPFAFEFARVDTIATSDASLTLSGALTGIEASQAIFHYLSILGLSGTFLDLETSQAGPHTAVAIAWQGLEYPRKGTYQLTAHGAFPRAAVFEVNGPDDEQQLDVQSGQVVLEVARRRALIGRFTIVAKVPGTGGTVTVTGVFSAGCLGAYC